MAKTKAVVPLNSDARPSVGSGAPVGLSMADQSSSIGDTMSDRVSVLVEKFGGMIEHQPVAVKDGRVQFRWVFFTAAGDAISGNGENDYEALENLEKRLAAWGASS